MSLDNKNDDTVDIKTEGRKDPTSFLPEEPMTYEIKKKKKKKKKIQEDPFKDIEVGSKTVEIIHDTGQVDDQPVYNTCFDPEVSIKVENIEVELDFKDFAYSNDELPEAPQSEDSQEPAVKIDKQNHEAVILTFENIVQDKNVMGYSPRGPSATHVCKVCHLVFKTAKSLRVHQRRQHKVFRKSFKHICDDCGMSYEFKNSLVAHIKRKHDPNSNPDDGITRTCEICALMFKGTARLRMHMRRKHGSFADAFKFVCKACGLTYDKHRSLIVHMQRKHSVKKEVLTQEWYNCPFCPKVFTRRETYARHVQRNHKIEEDEEIDPSKELVESCRNPVTGGITCKECPLEFASVGFFKLHMRRKHNALSEKFGLKCSICKLSYEKLESLKKHIRRKHENESYCDICNKHFESREQFISHNHVKTIRECTICGLIFASQGGLAKHMRCTHKIDTPKSVFCSVCNEGFQDKRQQRTHFLRVHLNIFYTCTECNKQFKTKESHKRHTLLKHSDSKLLPKQEKTLPCEQCSEMFMDEFELCRHINLVHFKKEENQPEIKKEDLEANDTYQCRKCSDTFQTWEHLRMHYAQNHFLEGETQCQMCGQIVRQSEFNKHMRQHRLEEMLQCKYCPFKTTSRVSMTQHLLRHKNAKTMHCDYPGCKYKTFYESAMDKHKKKHEDQGVKLQCSKCPFQTMNKYILKYHEEAHMTGKKRYKCDKCDYATILPANLVQHKYKHSSEKRFKCEFCPFATKYNTSLRFHVKNKHCDLPSNS